MQLYEKNRRVFAVFGSYAGGVPLLYAAWQAGDGAFMRACRLSGEIYASDQ